MKEFNIYEGYDTIVKYYQKNLPISFTQHKIHVKDLFLHFMVCMVMVFILFLLISFLLCHKGDVAIVTNQFEVKPVSGSSSGISSSTTNTKSSKTRGAGNKATASKSIPHYATTILVKSQNDQR